MSKKLKKVLAWTITFVIMLSLCPVMQPIMVEAEDVEYEILSTVDQVSSNIKVPETIGEKLTLTIASPMTGEDMHYYAEIEEINATLGNRFYTTVSHRCDSWFHNNESVTDAISYCDVEQGLSSSIAGNVYEITITRQDNNSFDIQYYNYTTGMVLATYHALNTGFEPDNTYFHIKNRSGEFQIYQGTAEENGFSDENNTIPIKITHGVDRTKLYTEKDIDNSIPSDYVLNEDIQGKAKDGKYNDYFLKDDIQTVKININENNLNYLLQNAGIKPSVLAESITIGNSTVKYVGLKTKGNNTLATTYNETESDRYSFTVNFGKYVKKKYGYTDTQNFYGCSKVSFNCMRADSTMMREYNSMRLMEEMGIPTPAFGMAKLYINNEYYGVYFMVEAMDNNILKRYQKSSTDITDYLVKPTYTSPYYLNYFDSYKDANGEFTLESLKDILYQDENEVWQAAYPLTEISGMWENDSETLQDVAEMIPTMLNWEYKLTSLSNGINYEDGNAINVDSEEYIILVERIFGDVEQTLRYFAAHSYIVQMDNMFTWRQNYGLHIGESGKATLVPWDYDLAWGALGEPNTAEEIANWDYDIMYNDVNPYCDGNNPPSSYSPEKYYSIFQGYDGYNVGTPLFNVFFQNPTLREKYHQYIKDCSKITTLGGTTTEGKSYDSGRFYSTIMDSLYEDMKTAASEELADNVYYLNDIQQPEAITEDMPELAELISQRAVGVWLQGYGINSKVCAGETSGGNLTIVDPATGIFTSALYTDDGVYPVLTVNKVATTSDDYVSIQNEIGSKNLEEKTLTVYQLSDAKSPTDGTYYTVYLPVADSDASVYTYDGKDLVNIETTAYDEDSILKVEGIDLDSKIVVLDGTRAEQEEPEVIPINATIQKDANVESVDLYYTSTYDETPDETNVATASARNSKTGEIDVSGDGQINILVNVRDGYEIDTITVTPTANYKNLKTPDETGAKNVYRITKMQGDIVVTITTKLSASDENDDTITTPVPTVEPTATPVPTVEPTATSVPTVKPTATSVPAVKPTATSVPAVVPTATPVPTVEPTATPLPTVEPTATPLPTVEPTATPVPTVEPTITPTSTPESDDANKPSSKDEDGGLKKGDTIIVGKAMYKVTDASTVEYIKPKSKSQTSIIIPDTITVSNKTYKVTAISANACKNCKMLKKITIGKNIKKISKQSFYKCKKLKTIIVKTTKLTSGSVGKNAFKGISKKAVMKVPKEKKKAYKKIFKKKGFSGKVK